MKLKQDEMYKIWWVDTWGMEGWHSEKSLLKSMKKYAILMETTALFVCEDKTFVCMATTHCKLQSNEPWGHVELIPKGCIKKIKKLKF